MTQRTIIALSATLFLGLLTWGIFSTVEYFGMQAHALVYMQEPELQSVIAACGNDTSLGTTWCRGLESMGIAVSAVFRTTKPFHTYVIISLIAYVVIVFWRGYTRGNFVLTYTLRPWHLIGGFALSVWLIATLLGMGSLYRQPDGPPFQRFYEPLPQVYEGLGEEALTVLNENYHQLLDAGCLREIGTTPNGARVYDMTLFCMQKSLVSRVATEILFLLFLAFVMLSAGRGVLRGLKIADMSPLLSSVTSLGLGSFILVVGLWTLAVLHLLTPLPVGLVLIGLPVVFHRDARYWLHQLTHAVWETDGPRSHILTILLWFLLSYLALNFLNVVRPFPIGWDDLGSYLNRPKLLASYGYFIPQLSTFQWEYLTALPFALFGDDSLFAATSAMLVNWMAGLFAVLVTYAFGRLFLGRNGGLTAAVLYYTLPMVGHFSFADMKIDNASYFVSSATVLLIFAYLFGTPGLSEHHRDRPGRSAYLIAAGLLAGFAFAIKPTAVLMILMTGSILAGALYGAWGFAALSWFGFAVLEGIGPLTTHTVLEKIGVHMTLSNAVVDRMGLLVYLGLAFVCGVIAFLRHRDPKLVRMLLTQWSLLALGIVLSVTCWMAHNAWSYGRVTSSTLLGFNDFKAPFITYEQEDAVPPDLDARVDKRFLTPDLKLDPENPACKIDSRAEELDRYWGFGEGVGHYLGLPWRSVMNVDIVGYYVTLVPVLLLLPLVFLLPWFWRPEARFARLLTAGTFVFLAQWILVGNGIVWYGIGMFLGIVVMIEAIVQRAPDKWSRWLMAGLIGASIVVALLNRMWQFDVQKNLFEYPLGKATSDTIREVTIPYYDDIRDEVLKRYSAMPERPYTYRIGTFIAYFIPRNKEIIPNADHQLQFFNCLNQEKNHQLTLARLKQLGFNGIIFDTNTATIEKDPNGTLHQKVNGFIDFISDPSLGLNFVVNDPDAGIIYVLLP